MAAVHAQGVVEPWRHPSFIDAITNLQLDRQIRASYQPDEVQFHDRCVAVESGSVVERVSTVRLEHMGQPSWTITRFKSTLSLLCHTKYIALRR